jgi:hypothetical protein
LLDVGLSAPREKVSQEKDILPAVEELTKTVAVVQEEDDEDDDLLNELSKPTKRRK